MDSQKIVARSNGFVPNTVTPYVAPSVPIRAFPSVDDDEEEVDYDYLSDDVDEVDFDYVSDELEDEGVGNVVEVNGRKEFSASSSFRILSSVGSNGSSEEEEEEVGGFLSDEEKFVGDLERPYVVGKVEQEEDVDVAFVESFESLRPIAKLSKDDEDDADVELSVSESDEEVANNDVIEISRAYVRSEDPYVLEVDNMEEDHFESGGLKSVEIDGVECLTEGASVVEPNNDGGNVTEPLVTVEDVKPDIVASSGSERPVEENEIDEDLSNEQVEICEKDKSVENVKEDVSELVTPSKDVLTVPDGVKLTSESDVVEEATQVGLQEPGVIVANGAEEIINLPDAEDRDNILVRCLTGEGSLKIECQAHDEVLDDCGEGDTKEVVSNMEEAKGAEVEGGKVQVTEKSIEEKEDEPLAAKLEDEVVLEDHIKFTTKGDSEVEATHLNVLEPVVRVVKDTLEGGYPEVNLLESDVGEDMELNGTVYIADEPSHSDEDGITETGIDESQDEMNEAGQSAQVHAISDSEDLDQKDADGEIQHFLEEGHYTEDPDSEYETDGVSVRSIEAAKQFLEELEQISMGGSHSGAQSSHYHSERIDGEVVTDSDEEVDTDEEEIRKQIIESAALAAFLKAASGGAFDSDNISAQDLSERFFASRPADFLSSLRGRNAPRQADRKESEQNLIVEVEERKKLESIQKLQVKFLRLVYRLGQSSEDKIAAHVLHRLALVADRSSSQVFSHEAAERTAKALENQGEDNLNFSLNILVIGKCGVGKSATINSIFGEEKTSTSPFESATARVKEITGVVDGVHIRVLDTPGLRNNVMDQHFNLKILASIKKATKKCPPDIVLYVDRLDSYIGNINDLPLLRTITSSLGPSIWQSAIVTLTHAATVPPDGLSGTPLNYELFVDRRSRAVQQSIGETIGEDQLMNQNLMIPVSLAENHSSCSRNRNGQKILPNGQAWRPQLLMFCYSMKILSEAFMLRKQPDQFDHQQVRPTLPFLLSWLLQSRTHPKFSADLGGEDGESGVDLNELLESEGEEDEYDQLPSFKPLIKSQLAKLSKEQLKAYYEEYDYRVELLQKKELKKALKTNKEMKKRKVYESELLSDDEANPENRDPTYVHAPLPDMVLPPSFDCGDPTFRYRFLESSSKLITRPVMNKKCWDHDFGYDIVNLEQSLVIASRFPADITVQLTKDKKKFKVHLDSSLAAKHENNGASTMAGFDIRNMKKHRAYTIRGETKLKNLKKNTTTAGCSVTYLDKNIATGVKIEDQLTVGKHIVLTGSTGAVRCQSDTIYGANLEIKLHDSDFPISQNQSSLVLSLVKMGGKLALGVHHQSQFSVGRKSKVDVGFGLNDQSCGQISIRTSTSQPLYVALVSIIPVILGILKAISWPEH